MKIFGIGTDIVNIKRMEKSLKLHGKRFKKNIFSKNEINYCEKKKTLKLIMPKDLLRKKHSQRLQAQASEKA